MSLLDALESGGATTAAGLDVEDIDTAKYGRFLKIYPNLKLPLQCNNSNAARRDLAVERGKNREVKHDQTIEETMQNAVLDFYVNCIEKLYSMEIDDGGGIEITYLFRNESYVQKIISKRAVKKIDWGKTLLEADANTMIHVIKYILLGFVPVPATQPQTPSYLGNNFFIPWHGF